ncbi:MAG TPA: hypothetical protein VGM13_12750 [Thermoanaerobaculia bacterium]|jgi:hypothetical protein
MEANTARLAPGTIPARQRPVPPRWRFTRLALSPGLSDHPRVHRLAETLGLSSSSALALLVQLWSGALRERQTGGLAPAYLAALCDWTDSDGPRGNLIAALVEQRLIERERSPEPLFRVQFPRDMARPCR